MLDSDINDALLHQEYHERKRTNDQIVEFKSFDLKTHESQPLLKELRIITKPLIHDGIKFDE